MAFRPTLHISGKRERLRQRSDSAPELGIEPFKAEATDLTGAWRIEGLAIPVAGTWQLDFDIRKSRFSLVRLSTPFDIPHLILKGRPR